MNFLRSLGNWALFLILAGGAIVVTYIAGMNLGNLSNIQIDFFKIAIEIASLIAALVFIGFALRNAWMELNTKKNGFPFGILFSVSLALLISYRFYLLGGDNTQLHIVIGMFLILFVIFFLWGFTIVPIKHRVLLVFFEKVLEKQEIADGMAWILPMSDKKIYPVTNQIISLSKMERMPTFPDTTTLEELDLQFMYHLLPGSLHEIINFGENWKQEVQVILEDSLRSSILAVSYLVTKEELEKYFFNLYQVYFIGSAKVLKMVISYGIIFPSTKEFPMLLEDAFFISRACHTFERLYLEKKGFQKTIVINDNGDRESIFVNSSGESPSIELLNEIQKIPDEEKVQKIVDDEIKVYVISHLQRDAVQRNGKKLANLPHKGLFPKSKKMAFMPDSLNIRLATVPKVLKDKLQKLKEEDTERKIEEKHMKTHMDLVKQYLEMGSSVEFAGLMVAEAQGMDLKNVNLVIRHYNGGKGDSNAFSSGLAGVASVLGLDNKESKGGE